MLIRHDGEAVIAISQPAHAWVSGQLARAWSERFEPWEEVCLAAEQHDLGWLTWEANPSLNQETGLPYTFREIPRDQHLSLWSQASTLALAYGRYTALLVSLHGTGLYERFGPGPEAPPDVRRQIDGLLDRERAFQQHQIDSLAEDDRYAAHVTPDAIETNRRLISVWDAMSLALCGGVEGSQTIAGEFTFTSHAGGSKESTRVSDRVSVEPWPFSRDSVRLIAEGRRLASRVDDADELRGELDSAPWVPLQIDLVAG